jgi:hypothetical protein
MILIFVAIGRSVHDHGVKLSGMISTTWPFAVGMAIGWLILVVRGRSATSFAAGVTVCLATVSVGMALRVVAGQGIAVAFVVVALVFLGAFMLGWRLLFAGLGRWRNSSRTN